MYRVSAHPLFSRYRLSAHPVNPPAHGFTVSRSACNSQATKHGQNNAGHVQDKKGRMKIPSRQNVIDWTSTAWDSIDVDIIIRSFLRYGISKAVDGSEDDEIRCHGIFHPPEFLSGEIVQTIPRIICTRIFYPCLVYFIPLSG